MILFPPDYIPLYAEQRHHPGQANHNRAFILNDIGLQITSSILASFCSWFGLGIGFLKA